MKISLIVAATDNDVISNDAGENWILPADLKHFRKMTVNHPIIMGRKTYEKIGRPLPERKNIVLTNQKNWKAEGVEIANSQKMALEKAGDDVFIIGGAEIWELFEESANAAFITRVHTNSKGSVKFALKPDQWEEISAERHESDNDNKFAYTFLTYKRR